MVQVALLLIVFGFVLLILAVSVEGREWLRYCISPVQLEAQVVDEVPYTFDCSRGTVEVMQADGFFQRLPETEDRSVGHLPFYHMLFEKDKVQYIVLWNLEGNTYRGHYRFLKKRGTWKVGQRVPLRCDRKSPWRFALWDEELWRFFLGKCLLDVLILFAGILLLIYAVG